MRPPTGPSRAAERRHEGIEYEIAQEKAAALGRSARRLEDALSALAAFDAAPPPRDPARREALLRAAGETLWYYVVQREAVGMRDTEVVMRELRVPREVQLRMGVFPSREDR
ncbi:MAG TPA: DUF6665 family protein [Longimicrobium sp.]|nr:DUF6665 family protein [Longimicrobium sp.]